MRRGLVDVTVLLDRSGSMMVIRDDAEGALAQFVKEQQAVPGEATLTVVLFDGPPTTPVWYQVAQRAVPIRRAMPIELVPRGSTALLDAMGRCITETGERLAAMPEADRPERVVLVVQTDGQENASVEWTKERVAASVRHQQEVYAWEVVFLGANMDAVEVGRGLGVRANNAMTYAPTGEGVKAAVGVYSRGLAARRTGRTAWGAGYVSDEDRDAAKP